MTNQWAVNILEDNMADYTTEEKVNYLEDVTTHGCVSGCVSGVIYYSETDELFRNHMKEILDTIEEYDYEMGSHMLGNMDASTIPNYAVWFVVEQTANTMLQEMEELEEA